MQTTMGINDFGRIGRLVLRAAIANPEVEGKAVDDPLMDLKFMVHQVRYDSVHNGLPGTIVMPITMGINLHANHHGHQCFGRIGRLASARPSPTRMLRSRQ